MMTKEGSTKIVNFITSGTEFLVLGHGHKNHITSENALFHLKKYFSLFQGIGQTN